MSGRTNFTKLFLEIGQNSILSLVSCGIAPVGKYCIIIPFRWWHQEHPFTNIANSKDMSFNNNECQSPILLEDKGILVEWDEQVLNDRNVVVIGQIENIDGEKITIIDQLPESYYDYLDVFRPLIAEKPAPRHTFDHVIDLKPDTQPPWSPIYPLSQKLLEAFYKCLDNVLKQGKLSLSKSSAGTFILCLFKPDCRLRLVVDYLELNKATIYYKYLIFLMTELGDQVRDAQIFMKLDLKDDIHLRRVCKGDECKTAFQTRY